MKKVKALLSMTRPGNSIMAAIGILIGYLYSGKPLHSNLLLLIIAGMSALAFGNVINDIVDIKTDQLAHPDRALVTGRVHKNEAILFCLLLTVLSITAGFIVSPFIGWATLIPIILLTIYSLLLKSTPLAGNITVSSLIAYTLIYGAFGGNFAPLLFPAILASLSNFSREIIKDIADKEGDLKAGLKTSATLPQKLLNILVYSSGIIALVVAPLPFILGQMGIAYFSIILLIVVPLGVQWMRLYTKEDCPRAARLLKIQMLMGMCAILCDRFLG